MGAYASFPEKTLAKVPMSSATFQVTNDVVYNRLGRSWNQTFGRAVLLVTSTEEGIYFAFQGKATNLVQHSNDNLQYSSSIVEEVPAYFRIVVTRPRQFTLDGISNFRWTIHIKKGEHSNAVTVYYVENVYYFSSKHRRAKVIR